MHVSGTTHIHGPHGINAPHTPRSGQAARPVPPAQPAGDRVEISPAAEAAIRAAEGGQIRHDLVNRIRAQIADGTYETPEKLDAAVDRLLDEIG
jgi:negative regulator of flagellin synthesis FlgM